MVKKKNQDILKSSPVSYSKNGLFVVPFEAGDSHCVNQAGLRLVSVLLVGRTVGVM